MTEWFEGRGVDDIPKAGTIVPKPVWAMVVGLAVAAVFYAGRVSAEPVFVVQDKDVTITIFNEECTIKDQVSNLPYRIVWTEGGKTFEGCAAPRPDHQLVVAYFSDHSIALIPFSVLQKAVSA